MPEAVEREGQRIACISGSHLTRPRDGGGGAPVLNGGSDRPRKRKKWLETKKEKSAGNDVNGKGPKRRC